MSPPRADVFKPPPDQVYSNGEVNRAGQLMRKFFYEPRAGHDPWDGWEDRRDDLINAMYAITWWKQQHARPLSTVAAALRYHVGKEISEIDGAVVDVTQRLKKRDTIINKLERFPRMDLTQMHDIGGVRARLPTLACLLDVNRRLKKTWTIVKTRDYIAEPKESGYRAIHLDVRRAGKTIEVQLRTVRQDAWANQVEDDGRRLGTGYKFGFGAEAIHSYFRAVSDVFWCQDSNQEISEALAEELQTRYAKIQSVLRPETSGAGE